MEHVMEMMSSKQYVEESDFEEEEEDGEERMIDTEDLDLPTTVTIVEEDGTTSVVDDASVVTEDCPSNTIQFPQSSSNMTYRVVGIDSESAIYPQQSVSGVHISPGVNVNGQYYLIGAQNVIGRPIAPRPQGMDGRSFGRVSIAKALVRDEKKRATHNEVERRRRDKINAWIGKLAKIVPNADEGSKQNQSKGGILAKTCEYIADLRSTNIRLAAALKEHENSAEEIDNLRRKLSEVTRENFMLKQQLGPTEEESTITITTSDN